MTKYADENLARARGAGWDRAGRCHDRRGAWCDRALRWSMEPVPEEDQRRAKRRAWWRLLAANTDHAEVAVTHGTTSHRGRTPSATLVPARWPWRSRRSWITASRAQACSAKPGVYLRRIPTATLLRRQSRWCLTTSAAGSTRHERDALPSTPPWTRQTISQAQAAALGHVSHVPRCDPGHSLSTARRQRRTKLGMVV